MYGFIDVNYLVERSRSSPRWARPAPAPTAPAPRPTTIRIAVPAAAEREQKLLAGVIAGAR
jgi:hypothetical protein